MSRSLPVDIGVFVSHSLLPESREAVERGAGLLLENLSAALPEFTWRLHVDVLTEPDSENAPLPKLERAVRTLEEKRIDFALYAVEQPLRGPRGAPLLAASSQLFGCAVFNTMAWERAHAGSSEAPMYRALLELFAALNGANEAELPSDRESFADSALVRRLRHSLDDIADQRLEENASRHGRFQFYLRGVWLNKREFTQALVRTRPWLFPVRLSRLSAGAVSASALLMLTAEAWQLALTQPWWRLGVLALSSLSGAVVYLLHRQRLLSHLRQRPLTERRVTAELASVAGVSFGIAATFGMLFVMALGIGVGVYPSELVESWGARPLGSASYLKMSCWTANFGMIVGALGASLEAPSSFRFLLIVDKQFEPGDS